MVTEEQWRAVASELGLSVDELHALNAETDRRRDARAPKVPPGMYYDRQGDLLTLGQWGALYETRAYRLIAETVLPSRRWIATIWTGVDSDPFRRPPIVLESTVFRLLPEGGYQVEVHLEHQTEAEALAAHADLVRGLCA